MRKLFWPVQTFFGLFLGNINNKKAPCVKNHLQKLVAFIDSFFVYREEYEPACIPEAQRYLHAAA